MLRLFVLERFRKKWLKLFRVWSYLIIFSSDPCSLSAVSSQPSCGLELGFPPGTGEFYRQSLKRHLALDPSYSAFPPCPPLIVSAPLPPLYGSCSLVLQGLQNACRVLRTAFMTGGPQQGATSLPLEVCVLLGWGLCVCVVGNEHARKLAWESGRPR